MAYRYPKGHADQPNLRLVDHLDPRPGPADRLARDRHDTADDGPEGGRWLGLVLPVAVVVGWIVLILLVKWAIGIWHWLGAT